MLNRVNRIGNRHVIEKLHKTGHLHKDRFLIFKYLKNDQPKSQFAVTVSKKVFKKANKRNKLKRQISESIRLNLDNLSENLIVLVLARYTCEKVSYSELDQSIQHFIKKVSKNAK